MANNLEEYAEMKAALFTAFNNVKEAGNFSIELGDRAESLSRLSEAYIKIADAERVEENRQPKNVTKVPISQ